MELTPKAFAVLRHLVAHLGRLVTKNELLDAVWGETIVSEAALASCIRDLRKALGDSSRSPRYIETVHRRGFRFIGPLESAPADGPAGASPPRVAPPPLPRPSPQLVGREDELARLHTLFSTALGGRRQAVFVTGEPGIGKTTLVEAFLAELELAGGVRIGRGQCVEQYGAGEAYLPVLEALGRMARDPDGDALVGTLRRYAPTWLLQLPALLADADLEAVERRALGSTRERMLRELVEALDALCSERPLVLLLEDLHWSDSATIDLLAMFARRRDPARLLILGTYRPADVAAGEHPLKPVKQELQLHGHCEELTLEFLGEAAVGDFLSARLPGTSFPERLVQVLHRDTSGNPLFLVNLVDDWIARGRIREVDGRWDLAVSLDDVDSDVPHTLAQMVERQIERLTPHEQAVLAVASVAGAEFSAALATVDRIDAEEAERSCAALTRRGHFLRAMGVSEWPDGTVAGRYGFIHALYRHVLYERVSIGRKVGLHLRIGARLEQAHGTRAGEIAGELAMHFEEGRDFERAVRYRRDAAHNALRHQGHHEAVSHASRALELLASLPESLERTQQELAVQTVLGAALLARGSTAPEVVRTYARTRELCTRAGTAPELFPALVGLFRYYISRAELPIARDLADRLLTLAQATADAEILLGAHNTAGIVSFYAGDFGEALAHLERGLQLYDERRQGAGRWPAFWGGHEAGVSCTVHAAWALWVLGNPTRAAARMRDALDRARSAGYPFALANACVFAGTFHALCGDADGVRRVADEAVLHSTEHGFELLLPLGDVLRGWWLSATGQREQGAAMIRSGVTAYRDNGAGIGLPTFLGFLAEAHAKSGRRDEGLVVVADALAMSEVSGAHYWDSELRRLQGALLLASASAPRRPGRRESTSAESEAELCFESALEIARAQSARSLELRAATSLGRLWHGQGKTNEARALLSEIYGEFDEGFETPDLTQASELLEALGGSTRRR
jgi:predicted ATPase